MSKKLTHIDEQGRASMVDVGPKPDTERIAVARGEVHMKSETLELIRAGQIKKGDVLTIAQIAGITAAKRTSDLIPLCHPLSLTKIDVDLALDDSLPGVVITATAKVTGKTGVEMEALTAVSVAALTPAPPGAADDGPARRLPGGGHARPRVAERCAASSACSDTT